MNDFRFADMTINLLLAAVWISCWNLESRETVFNAYLSRLSGAMDAWIAMLRPALGARRRLPILIGTFGLLMALRGLLIPGETVWGVRLGFLWVALSGREGPGTLLALSALSFGLFLFTLWGITLFYLHDRDAWGYDQAGVALHRAARPFTDLPVAARPFVLLGYGIALTLAILALERGGLPHVTPEMIPSLLASVLAGWVQIIGAICSLLWVLIIGSLVSMFAGGYGVRQVCDDWINLLLGPFRRYPLRLGMFDLTPWLFLILATWVERGLLGLLGRVGMGGAP